MAEEQVIQPNAEEKKASIPKMLIGAAIALAIAVAMMYFGLFNQCCGLGYLAIACVALYIPKYFGMNKMQHLIILGVVFFLVLTLLGAFVVSKPMIKDNSDVSAFDNDGFSNVTITYNNGTADIQVTYTGTGTEPKACFYQVQSVTYQMITKTKGENFEHPLTATATPNVYQVTGLEAPAGFVYLLEFHYTVGEETKSTTYVYFTGAASDSEITNFCLLYNAYTCGVVMVIFLLMLILTTIMRRNLEKTRARMEAEGRLYPQGYGRCKECGAIVLPGETCCRKCGAYIDVPDELRHRKVDMVECSECGAEIPEDAKVCPKCGATFDEEEEVVYVDSEQPAETKVEMVQCSECGEMIPETAEVCPKCGATFDEEEEIVVEEKKE